MGPKGLLRFQIKQTHKTGSLLLCFSAASPFTPTHSCPSTQPLRCYPNQIQDTEVSMDLDALLPAPALSTQCGRGCGLAVCPTLGLLVTSNFDDNTLSVFALPGSSHDALGLHRSGLTRVCTLGDRDSLPESLAPMRFDFQTGLGFSGHLAFTGPTSCRLLLVTDTGNSAVHVIDVVRRVHVGYVAAPGTIAGPRGVAARGSLVAVSAWAAVRRGDHVVHLFEGSGATWTPIRVLACGFGRPGGADGQLDVPYGLRFTGDGKGLVVAGSENGRVSLFTVEDGSFVRRVASGLHGPFDVEECAGGWLVACFDSHTVDLVHGARGARRARLGREGSGHGEFKRPVAIAAVPGLGLVVREKENEGRLQVFANPEDLTMALMSRHRVGWMVAVARGVAARSLSVCVADM